MNSGSLESKLEDRKENIVCNNISPVISSLHN